MRHPYFGDLKLNLADEPGLIPEGSNQHKSRRDENKQVDSIRNNSNDVSSDRERKPKRTNVQHHTNTKGTHKYKLMYSFKLHQIMINRIYYILSIDIKNNNSEKESLHYIKDY